MEHRPTHTPFAWAILAVAVLLEIAMAFFASLYLAIVVIRLALWGLTPDRLGTASVELPQVVGSFAQARERSLEDASDIADMIAALGCQEARIRALEQILDEAEKE